MKKYGCYFVALMGATALTPQMALAQDIKANRTNPTLPTRA